MQNEPVSLDLLRWQLDEKQNDVTLLLTRIIELELKIENLEKASLETNILVNDIFATHILTRKTQQ